ncbi:hypothetical protein KIF59_23520 [Enterobacter cloacae subsp. cloacae]|nr:hypothetical protein [Enterobacter cloacae subsp. cloacae]
MEELHRHLPALYHAAYRAHCPLVFRDEERDIDWLPGSTIEISEDVLGVVSLAEQGWGICQSYDLSSATGYSAGQLVEVLPHLRGRSRPFSVLFAPHRRQSAATRAMIDLLTNQK